MLKLLRWMSSNHHLIFQRNKQQHRQQQRLRPRQRRFLLPPRPPPLVVLVQSFGLLVAFHIIIASSSSSSSSSPSPSPSFLMQEVHAFSTSSSRRRAAGVIRRGVGVVSSTPSFLRGGGSYHRPQGRQISTFLTSYYGRPQPRRPKHFPRFYESRTALSTTTTTTTANMNRTMDSDNNNSNKEPNNDDEILVDTDEALRVLHLKRRVDSTQDETKRLLQKYYDDDQIVIATKKNGDNTDATKHAQQSQQSQFQKPDPISLAVIADDQSHGRGTSGRSWVSSVGSTSGNLTVSGNLFLTYALPMNLIPMSQVTLLPLAVGLVVAETISMYLHQPSSSSSSSRNLLNLKWPNDVLLNDCKIAGTLIENARIIVVEDDDCCESHDYWLVGIGVNIASHPTDLQNETTTTTDAPAPRRATSLKEYCTSNDGNGNTSPLPTAVEFGTELALKIQELVSSEWSSSSNTTTTNQNTVVDRWRRWAQMGTIQTIRDTGEVVKTVGIMDDGRLHVIDHQGNDKYLISDYFV